MLFIDNLVDNGQTQCMGWGWYLQNDMQLFIFSMFILFLYNFSKLVSKLTLFVSTLGSLLFTYFWTKDNGTYVITHLVDFGRWGNFFQDVYVKPWARAPPYLFGLFLGMLYVQFLNQSKLISKKTPETIQNSENSEKPQRKQLLSKLQNIMRRNKFIRMFVEILGIGLMLFLVMIPRTLQQDITWSQQLHSLYLSVAKFLFVIALSFAILPSLLGSKNSMVGFVMDTSLFNFIAKISFCTYLVHLIVMEAWVGGMTYNKYYQIVPQFADYAGILVISLFLGLIMTFLIQTPFAKLQKMFVNFIKQKVSKEKVHDNESNNSSTMNLNKTLINS